MDKHIEELFEAAQPFDEGELFLTPECDKCFRINIADEERIQNTFGPKAEKLLMKFLDSYYEVERLECLHYFYQGYLAAKAELEAKKV